MKSQGGAGLIRQGLDFARRAEEDDELRDRAEAAEIDAGREAARAREQGREEAAAVSRRARRNKARRMTLIGGSGLALSGSPLLALEAEAARDGEDEADVRNRTEDRAQDLLRSGRERAETLRGRRSGGSLLSLGSRLWDNPFF